MSQKLFPLFKGVTGPVTRAVNAVILQQIISRNLNQRQFAEDAHISESELTLIKRSHRFIRLNTVEHVAGALKMMPSELLALTERMVWGWRLECRACDNCCMETGRLKHLDSNRGCLHPAR